MVDFNVRVEIKGNLLKKGVQTAIRQSLPEITKEVAEVAKKEATRIYLAQRKSDDPKSMIIESMTITPEIYTGNYAKTILTAGGSKAPYIRYVEYPRKTQNFRGYYFMRGGAEVASEQAKQIALKIIKKHLR